MKKFLSLSLIIALLFSQPVYAATYPPYEASYGVSPQASVEFEGKIYDQTGLSSYNDLKNLLAGRYHWYHTDMVMYVSPIKFMNGKIYYDMLPDGDTNLPWILTHDEYIQEEGIYNYFKSNYPVCSFSDPFIDLGNTYSWVAPNANWYNPYAKRLIVEGLITGYPETDVPGRDNDKYKYYSFGGDRIISRAELVTILSKLQLKSIRQYQDEFDDVQKTDWYYNAIKTAYEMGIIEREENDFDPNGGASREFAAQVISRVIKTSQTSDDLDFTDKTKISAGYLNGVTVLYSNKIISGYKDKSFRPQNTITRGELASMLAQCLDQNILNGKTPCKIYAENYLEEYKETHKDEENAQPVYNFDDFEKALLSASKTIVIKNYVQIAENVSLKIGDSKTVIIEKRGTLDILGELDIFGQIKNKGKITGSGKMVFYSEPPNIGEQISRGDFFGVIVFDTFYLSKKFDTDMIEHFLNKNSIYTHLVLGSKEKFNVTVDSNLTIPKNKYLVIDSNGTLEIQKNVVLSIDVDGGVQIFNKPIINGTVIGKITIHE